MFNKKSVLFFAEIKRKTIGYFKHKKANHIVLKGIKKRIRKVAYMNRTFIECPYTEPESAYIDAHKQYFLKRGFEVEIDERYTRIKW